MSNTTTINSNEVKLRYTPPIHWGVYVYEIPLYTRWHHQGLPSNKFTPNNYSAGCNAVAMGQIMVYHQWPRKGRYKRYGTIDQKTSYPANVWPPLNKPMAATAYQDYISDLVAEIGYKMVSEYKSPGLTLAVPSKAYHVFRQMGYECDWGVRYDALPDNLLFV